MKYIYLVLTIFLVSIVSAQLGYNNPNLPRIEPTPRTTTTVSGGSNVSSVTSSTNCITVNPTTGDVILTFNSSCATGSSFNQTYHNFAYNQTTAVFLMQLLNDTISDWGRRVGFNSTFNSTYNNFAYNQSDGSFNSTYAIFAYNQTTATFTMTLLNDTISDWGNRIGFNSTYNSTYDSFAYNQSQNVPNNSTRLHCSNVTGNSLCTTDIPTFSGLLSLGLLRVVRSGIFEDIMDFYVFGGAIYVGKLTAISGYLQFLPASTGIVVGNLSNSAVDIGRTEGHAILFGNKTTKITGNRINAEINDTLSTFYGNTSIKGTLHNWAVANGVINATGQNITSNHQTYNITSATSLDTTYTNTNERTAYIDFSFKVTVSVTADTAIVRMFVNGTECSIEGQDGGLFEENFNSIQYHHLGCFVPPNVKYSFNTTVAGSGSVTRGGVFLTVI